MIIVTTAAIIIMVRIMARVACPVWSSPLSGTGSAGTSGPGMSGPDISGMWIL